MTERELLNLALEAFKKIRNDKYSHWEVDQEIHAIEEALAQPEQKVDWEKLYRLEVKKKEALSAKYERDIKPLTKIVPMAQPEQGPVAWLDPWTRNNVTTDYDAYGSRGIPLYITPPQRKPQYDKTEMNCFVQDLYDKKMQEGKRGHYETMFHVVHRAIESAYGIKENI